MIQNKHLPFRLAVIAVFMAIILPTLFLDGMFMDGLLYACVGKNLAQGIGTWWHPQFSVTYMTDYHEQPPLLFWLQSFFFKIFGTAFWVERLYSLLAAVTNALLIAALWKKLFTATKALQYFSWLPVLFWIIIPVCSFTFINNLEEGTMSIFALASVYCIVSALQKETPGYILLLSGGFFVLCAAMTKGIQGTFPVIVVFFHWLVFRKLTSGQMIACSLVVISVPVFLFGLMLTNPVIYDSFRSYYYDRINNTFVNAGMHTTDSHFGLLLRLLLELSPVLFLVLVIFLVGKCKFEEQKIPPAEKRYAIFFFLTGLSAAAPLMITLEQRSFYLTTSLPYFALGFSMLAMPHLKKIIAVWIPAAFISIRYIAIAAMAVVAVITITSFGQIKRDHGMLHDLDVISTATGNGMVLNTTDELFTRWNLQGYCMRYYNISLDPSLARIRPYLLLNKTDAPAEGYALLDLPTKEYALYKRVN